MHRDNPVLREAAVATDTETRTEEYRAARLHMVDTQILPRGIHNQRVIQALGRVPRDEFVPAFLRDYAYEDHPQPIGYEQTISQPYIVALMSEALELKGHEHVLEIGTGSGYQTAILAELCADVYSIERIPELGLRAKLVLEKLGYTNVHLRVANGTFGWPEAAPFDAILTTAGATTLPRAYQQQLVEGGRLVIPLGPHGDQVLHRFIRRGDRYEDQTLGRVAFVPLVSDRPKTGP